MLTNKQIEEMTDDQLFQELKRFKKLIYKTRKSGDSARRAEEEISYLQQEAQNRGHKV
jgi:hypothetical protein